MVDITNSFGAYMQIPTFRFWCQHVIPLVYDDSLSYYEVLCKTVDYINNIIADLKTTQDNLSTLAEATEGDIAEIKTLVNSSLEGSYGGLRRKVLALTESARDAMADERIQHLRVSNINYSAGELSYITFRLRGKTFNLRCIPSSYGNYGLINGIRGYDISLSAMYGHYNTMVDSYTSWDVYVNGNPGSLEDLYVGQLLNELTIIKRQSENCYIVTHINSTNIYIYYRYDAANIPGATTSFARNPYIRPVSNDSTTWNDTILDDNMQVTFNNGNRLVIAEQDKDFLADTWHKLEIHW